MVAAKELGIVGQVFGGGRRPERAPHVVDADEGTGSDAGGFRPWP